jgi:PAS domain S-box-containing protein
VNLSADSFDHPARILIVDDEPQNRQLLEVMLASEGFLLQTAASGEEALAIVASLPPDLILLDVMMPGMDGYQVASQLKGDLATKNIPVIMVTAVDDRDVRIRGLSAGAEDFLTKPVDRPELCLRVRNLLRLKAYSDYHDKYSQMLEGAVALRAAELVQSERLYRSTFDAAPVGILQVGLDRRWLRVNQRLCDLLGYSHTELQSVAVQQLVQAEQAPGEAEALCQMAAGTLDRHVVDEKRYQRRDGSVMWARVNMSVHRDADGGAEYFISVIDDLTERRALDAQVQQGVEAIRTGEERMRFALEHAGVGIWDLDCTTGVLRWSEIIEAHYGLLPGTFGGTFEAFVQCIHPDDRTSVIETVQKAMKSGADFSVQHRSIRPDGAMRWLSGAGRILLGEHGEPVRGVGISLDVTEQRTLEAQYQQAQKMEAVGRLAGGVAHDFNNLLTVILGYCELLLADVNPGDPHQADLAEIKKAGGCAAGLTRQLLAFSRKQIIEPTLLDLNMIATELLAMLGRLIGEDVRIVLGLQPELALVKADRGQVEQIVMNLAVNARDAMPKGGTLTIETANVALDEHYAKTHLDVKPGAYVVVTVTDTGTGMTPQVQARLFEPFFTTKEPGKGTGLGMATVYGIVTRSGGSIGVYSEVGKGTAFKVYFPRADGAEMVAELTAPVVRPTVGMQTVLVVEDEDGLRELARRLLERQGYTVLAASNADEALRLVEENPSIDVLLTDVVMPGASGPELTRQLIEQRPALRVIYMSGYTEEAMVRHGIRKAGIAFLHKPFTSDTLGQKIREVLEQQVSLSTSAS